MAVASVQVSPATFQVEAGASVTLTATPRDANGNALSDRPVTWSSGNPAVASVTGTGSVSGMAPGSTTVTATSGGVPGTANVTVIAGPASQLAFTLAPGPGTVVAGAAFAPAIQVTARDALGNTATEFTGPVTVALGANPGGATLAGTTTVSAVAGVATFAGLSLDKSGVGYTLQASAAGVAPVASAPFSVTPAAATHLVFSVQPGNTAAGAVISPALQVTARDAFGNTATGFTDAVTVAIGTNPAGGTLAGTTTVNAVAGVAILGSLSIDKAGIGYTLSASATGLSGATSTTFDVSVGAATAIALISGSAQTDTVAATLALPYVVRVTDAGGNGVSGVTVNWAVTGGGGTITPGSVTNATGHAQATRTLGTVPGSHTATGSVAGLAGSPVSFTATAVPGTASQLAFTVQPSSAAAGATITPAIQVTARDAFGNAVPAFTGTVTLAIGTNPPGTGVLDGTVSVAAVAGIATFPGLSIDEAGAGYTLTASATGLSGTTSNPFTITPGGATQLAFTVQPGNTAAGAAITPAVQVTARDAFGNTATGFTANVTVALGTNPPGNGTLDGTATIAAVAGVASFPDLDIDEAGVGYTLTAGATGLSGATSNPFTITAGGATQLAFTVQPGNTAAGAAITPAVQVTARDALGNTVTSFTGSVSLAIGTNPPGTGVLDGTINVAAVAGVANFPGINIDEAGTGYTLTASATGLPGTTSDPFNIIAGAATQLAFTVEPGNTAAGAAISPAVQVTARDAFGNSAPTFTGTVTLAVGTNPPGTGVLDGTAGVAAVAGVASFPGINIDEAGAGYTLVATAPGLTQTTSAPFTITPGPATQLAFTIQPGNTAAGAPFPSAVQVTARDALGNTATGFTGTITVAIGTNPPPGGVLDGTTTVAAVAGVASFPDLNIDEVGVGYTLTAAATGLTGATSAAFTISAGGPAILAFTVEPSNAAAGAAFAPVVQVTARDALGNTATGFTGTITVAIGTNPPSTGALDGTTSVAAVAGVANFPGLNIDEAGAGYTLVASAAGLTGATSGAFTIAPGAATQLAFTVQPGNTAAGAAITPAVQVTARDAFGNTAPTFTGTVTLAIGTNPPGTGALDGTTSVAAVAGVATFPGINIDEAGAGYTLVATATGLTQATSAPFTITPGAATQLAFTVQPGNTAAGAAITPAVQVTARDALGNTATGFTGNVTLAIGTNPPGNGVLDGTTTVAAALGVASFTGINIDEVGTGYTLTAAATGLGGATSATFNITAGAASQLAFTVQPNDAVAGAAITPAVQVTARDAVGNTVPTFTGTVTLAIGTNPPGTGVLDGTVSVAAVAGVATFSGVNIDEAGAGYTLTASATGLTGATSESFTILAGAATGLAFTVQPSATGAGVGISPAVQVSARDAFGNTATAFTETVTLAIGTNPPGTGVLDGTTAVAAAAGVASFPGINIDEAGAGYTLVATATGLNQATSAPFTIAPGPATQLAFTVQPGNVTAGAAFTPAVQVTARDALGNTATGFTATITVTIGTNPPPGGALDGTTSVAAVAGVASFPGLNIDEAGVGYTLNASATGLTGAVSAAFNVTAGAANRLAFTVQPVTTTAGVTITPAVQVTARDSVGNTATGFTGNVMLAIGTNPPGNGVLDGTTTLAATAGVATFPNLDIDEAGAGYTLTASAAGLTGATSGTFTITPGAATLIAFTVQPSNATAGAAITPAVQVTARDALGNTATGFTGTVTLGIGTNPGSGVLDGTTSVAAVAGVANFPGLNIDEAGAGYTLIAGAGGVADTTSAAFTITAAAATQLAFTVQPSNSGVGVTITPPVQVSARDAFGNLATSFTGQIAVAIGTNPPGNGVLDGTTTVAAVAGVAAFSTLDIDEPGTGYTLTASATGLSGATSTPFTISGNAATQLAFTEQPTDEIAGVAITPAIQVTARDAQGATVAGFTGNITISISTNPGGSTLSGTTTVAAVAGIATFPNLSLDRSASGYRLQATATGLATATSTTFAIAPAAAARVEFAIQPTTTAAGSSITPAVRVRVVDAFGNIAGDPRRDVTVALLDNPAGATLSGTLTDRTGNVNAPDSGVAIFSNLSLNKAGLGYTLAATSAGLAPDTSAAFDITPGAASQLAFTVEPTTTAAGASITPAIQVTARDAFGNTATGFTGNVTLAIGTNPPGNGALDGTTTVAAVAGIATFSGLNIDEAGVGYTLTASDGGGVTGATSAAFTITPGAANQLAFTVQPSNTAAGAAITPAVQVTARDALGNTATGFTGTVALAIGINPPGDGVLDGTTSVAAVAGVASFPGINIDETGAGYTLTASATGLTGATSAAFSITGGGVSATLSTLSAATDSIGQCLAPCALGFGASRVTLTVRDGFGNPVAGAAVTLSAASPDSNVFTNPGPSGVTDADGVFQADFSSGQAAAKILSAVAAGTPLSGTDTVHVMPVLVGAGDIADCNRLGDDATANLLDGIPGAIYTTGDNVYPNGRTQDFANCYDPTWGRHTSRTRPTPGNHEYDSSATAAPYFAYFGANAGTAPDGYYSYDVGLWHVVVLNDNVPMTTNSAQVQWLRADLNGRRNQCVIAYWHRPRYSSGPAGRTTGTQPLWQALSDSGADIVLWGHDHAYERFAPMDAAGNPSATGIRAFVVGTGGGETLVSGFPNLEPNSEVRDNTSRGVLRFTLYDGRYRWEFLPAPGFGTFTDAGSGSCN